MKEIILMKNVLCSAQDVIQQGEELYEQQLRSKLDTAENRGKFLSLDILSGEYEIDEDDLTAEERLMARRPDALIYAIRIGYPAAYRMGGVNPVRAH